MISQQELKNLRKGDDLIVSNPNSLSRFDQGDIVKVFYLDHSYPYIEVERYYDTTHGWMREPMLLEELSTLEN